MQRFWSRRHGFLCKAVVLVPLVLIIGFICFFTTRALFPRSRFLSYRVTMKATSLLMIPLVLLLGCGEARDCRHKAMECATGFACEQSEGDWICRPSEGWVGPPPGAPPRTPVENSACRQHKLCLPHALECECDPQGRLLSRTLDKDDDGNPDEKAAYEHNDDGLPVKVTIDLGLDGTDDKQHSYTYDERRNPLTWEFVGLPGGSDPSYKSRLSYRYDESGDLVAEELDEGIDGSVNKRCVYDPPCRPPIPNPSCKRACD